MGSWDASTPREVKVGRYRLWCWNVRRGVIGIGRLSVWTLVPLWLNGEASLSLSLFTAHTYSGASTPVLSISHEVCLCVCKGRLLRSIAYPVSFLHPSLLGARGTYYARCTCRPFICYSARWRYILLPVPTQTPCSAAHHQTIGLLCHRSILFSGAQTRIIPQPFQHDEKERQTPHSTAYKVWPEKCDNIHQTQKPTPTSSQGSPPPAHQAQSCAPAHAPSPSHSIRPS